MRGLSSASDDDVDLEWLSFQLITLEEGSVPLIYARFPLST